MSFDIKDIKNKRVLIKAFLFESGLWYLAKSLGDVLSKNNYVCYVPKAKYVEAGGPRFNRTYPKAEHSADSSGLTIEEFSATKSVQEQIGRCIEKHNIDLVISFETLMETGQWTVGIKRGHGVEIYDVPMPEWVTKSYVDNKSYKVFDRILCLTDVSCEIFKDYKNATKCSWDYVDRDLFFEPKRRPNDLLRFYHAASTNPDSSSKNTLEVIRAFNKFSNKNHALPVELTITGNLTEDEFCETGGSNNILINNCLDRQEISELYRSTHCIIAPSKREGLGLAFFEAKASGCSIITSNCTPMMGHSEYLCEIDSYSKDKSLVSLANIHCDEILKQLSKYYEDFIMSSKVKVKEVEVKPKKRTKKQVDDENSGLMSAFSEPTEEVESVTKVEMDGSVLEKLMAKSNKTKLEEDVAPTLIDERTVSINMAIIGVGQAGSRIAEELHTKGYDVGVINTSSQDLEYINVTPSQKLLIRGSLGGTGKDLDLGRELFSENESEIKSFVDNVIDGNDMAYLAISGGGGTGSSSIDTLIPMLFNTGMPVGVIYVLPKATEDAKSKKNSIETLSRLAKMTSDNLISNLIVVDNARIEQIYANLSQSQFWSEANKAIVEPLHLFNTLTSRPSRHTSLDPSDFGKIVSCGDCSIYGVVEVDDYMEETALAEAVIESLGGNMLAEGFDLSQTRIGGVIITGTDEALDRLPAININYCFHMISEQTNGASVFQGIYSTGSEGSAESVKIYAWFAGLGLPKDRVESLRRESAMQSEIAAEKERNRGFAMNLDLGEDKVNSVTEEVNRKIKKKKSGFSKLQRSSRGSIIDRRRKR